MSLNIFAFNIFKQLASEEPGSNILCSPYSVSSAISMLLLGADGDTKLELEKALSVNGSAEFHQKAASMQDALAGDAVAESLKIANKLFLEKSFPVNDTFKNELAKFYKASCALEDFISKRETSRQNINRWVAEKTQEKIQDLMPPNSISCDTRLVLANAVHFKGKWKSQFDKARTISQVFHTHENKIVKVDMMRKKARYPFAVDAGENMMMLEMYYQNSPISMVIILPTGNLEEIEKSLDAAKFAALYKSLLWREVIVGVPKFTLEFEKDLCNSFREMGAGGMLTPAANFHGISDSDILYVDAIAHKAFIAVDEEGTEAAAATGINVVGRSIRPPPPEFVCNRPFLFFLYHKPTEVVLFTGKMLNPSAQE